MGVLVFCNVITAVDIYFLDVTLVCVGLCKIALFTHMLRGVCTRRKSPWNVYTIIIIIIIIIIIAVVVVVYVVIVPIVELRT